MKRYLVFAGTTYYPSGGWNDYVGDFDSLKQARQAIVEFRATHGDEWIWWDMVDSVGGRKVEEGEAR